MKLLRERLAALVEQQAQRHAWLKLLLDRHLPDPAERHEHAANVMLRAGMSALATDLMARQIAAIRASLLPGRPTVALFSPLPAYRHHFGTLLDTLGAAGCNAIGIYSDVVGDIFDRHPRAFYVPGDQVPELDFVDVTITNTLIGTLPRGSRNVLLVHDIQDSPMGERAEFLRFAGGFDYFVVASTGGVDSMKRIMRAKVIEGGPARFERPMKCIVPAGYVRLDQNIRDFERLGAAPDAIIYAPTVDLPAFGEHSSIGAYGFELVRHLMERFPDRTIIFRPHPNTRNKAAIERIVAAFSGDPRFVHDANKSDYMSSYARSALMLTDMSGTAYTYAFTTLRPVVFFAPSQARVPGVDGQERYFRDRERVGAVVDRVEDVAGAIRGVLAGPHRERIEALRGELIFNVGGAERYLAENLAHMVDGTPKADWIYLTSPDL